MRSHKPAKSRQKLSFAVDRAEIDISSDWVQAVMQRPSLPPSASPQPGAEVLASRENRATVEDIATVAEDATVAPGATVAEDATVAENATVALFGGSYSATVAENATVELPATVEENTTVAIDATVAVLAAARRTFRLKPIRRITDALTPGQYAVYSLMFDTGEGTGQGSRLFRGGYVDLVRLTGLSKRGIQNVVGELQKKLVIGIYQAPGYHRTQSTVYEVLPEEAVLQRWREQGLQYSMGKSKELVNISTVAHNATVAE